MNNAMKPSEQALLLLEYRKQGYTLLEATIVELLRRRPLYWVQLRELLETDNGTLNKVVKRLIDCGVLEKVHETAATGLKGAPMSSLLRLRQAA